MAITPRELVEREIFYHVSDLICAATQNWESAVQLGFGEDDLITLSSRRADADDYGNNAPSSLQVARDGDSFKWKDGEGMWSPPFDSKLDAYRNAFDEIGEQEPDGSQCVEHWIVSDWLAEKLEAHGESVARDVLGLTIWGRTNGGQAIFCDWIIEEIARELNAPDEKPRYAIEPQRDMFKGKPEGADGSTNFEYCEEAEAENWAVFDVREGLGAGPSLVEDFPSRAAAEAFIAEQEA
jgi:hypothetical protein